MVDSYLFFMLCVLVISILAVFVVCIIIKKEEQKDEAKHQRNRKTIRFLKKYMEYESKKNKVY